MCMLLWIEHVVVTTCLLVMVSIWLRSGMHGVLSALEQSVKTGLSGLYPLLVGNSPHKFVHQVSTTATDPRKPTKHTIPEKGISVEELVNELKVLKSKDPTIDAKKSFTDVFSYFDLREQTEELMQTPGSTESQIDHAVRKDVMREFHRAFLKENAQNPIMSPSLRQLEQEVVSMTADMLHGDDQVVGCMTSGGTESLIMAMKTYRERAKTLFPHINEPEMVAPVSIHPAHDKAAAYFGFTIVHVPLDENCLLDLDKYEQAITENTICLLCSAPQYCHGMVDPIKELSELAMRRGLPLHVDACFGGFVLPWVEQLGYQVPTFDFRLQGVTSMSADIHKYGCGPKGSSVVLFRNEGLRKYQIFTCPDGSGGWFASQGLAGARPAGIIASSWITLKYLGQDGYRKMSKEMMQTTDKLKEAINRIPGICVLGSCHCTLVAIGSEDPEVDLLVLADELEEKGWKAERQHNPPAINCAIVPHHSHVIDQLIKELQEATEYVKGTRSQATEGNAAQYKLVAMIPDKSIVDDFLTDFFSEIYRTGTLTYS